MTTHFSNFMKWRATFCFPVGLGVELGAIHTRFEVLVGEQFMNLASYVCVPGWRRY